MAEKKRMRKKEIPGMRKKTRELNQKYPKGTKIAYVDRTDRGMHHKSNARYGIVIKAARGKLRITTPIPLTKSQCEKMGMHWEWYKEHWKPFRNKIRIFPEQVVDTI